MRTGDGDRLRAEKFAGLRRKPWYQSLLVLPACAALVYFAAQQNVVAALAVPAGLVAAILIGGYAWADSSARKEVMRNFAAARGLAFLGDASPPTFTPLLRAGDEREMSCVMTGPTGGMEVLLGHYTYTDIREYTDSKGNRHRDRTDHDFTIVTTSVEPAMVALPSLYLKPRGFLGLGSGWLKTGNLAECETESDRFNDRFKAWHREDQDPMVLRRFLDPSTIDTLANHPLDLGVEISAGQLLVYIEDHCADSGELGGLLDLLAFVRGAVFAAARVEA